MNFNDYQDQTEETAFGYATSDSDVEITREEVTLLYLSNAINGEAGELAEKVKKAVREDDEEYLDELRGEIGDIFWYLARLADELDVPLSDVAAGNLDKLFDRQDRNVLTGEGDDR